MPTSPAREWIRIWRAGKLTTEELRRRCQERLRESGCLQADGEPRPPRDLPVWLGGENSNLPRPAGRVGQEGPWNLPPEEINTDEHLVRWIHALLERLTDMGAFPVLVSPTDLARRLGADTQAVVRVLAQLRGNGTIGFDDQPRADDPRTIRLWKIEERWAHALGLDKNHDSVVWPPRLEESPKTENTAKNATRGEAVERGEHALAPEHTCARPGQARPGQAIQDGGVSSQAFKLGSDSPLNDPARPGQAVPGERGSDGAGGPAGLSAAPASGSRAVVSTAKTRPSPIEARAHEIARRLGDAEHASAYVSILECFPKPELVDRALKRALATPASEIRISRSALFRYLLRRIGRETEAERQRKAEANRASSETASTSQPRP